MNSKEIVDYLKSEASEKYKENVIKMGIPEKFCIGVFGIIRYLASSPSLLECPYWFWRVSVSVRSLSPFLWHGFWVGCNLYFIFKRTKDD